MLQRDKISQLEEEKQPQIEKVKFFFEDFYKMLEFDEYYIIETQKSNSELLKTQI